MINEIEVTDVIIFPVKKQINNCAAFCRLILNDSLIISGIKIMQGRNGTFVKLLAELNEKTGKSYDYILPATAQLRSHITEQILSKYRKSVNI